MTRFEAYSKGLNHFSGQELFVSKTRRQLFVPTNQENHSGAEYGDISIALFNGLDGCVIRIRDRVKCFAGFYRVTDLLALGFSD